MTHHPTFPAPPPPPLPVDSLLSSRKIKENVIKLKKILRDDHVLYHLDLMKINKHEFQFFCKMAQCIGKTVFWLHMTSDENIFHMKMSSWNFIHTSSKSKRKHELFQVLVFMQKKNFKKEVSTGAPNPVVRHF
jgi:hypothetical protein